MTITRKQFTHEIIKRDEDGGQIIITTPTPDRDKDRVIPEGVQLENYYSNPVVMYGHQYHEPWNLVGNANSLDVGEKAITADFSLRPAANEHDPQAIVRLLWGGGWLKTSSIGFSANPEAVAENDFGGLDFNEWELLEFSLVAIPANAEAIRLAVKNHDVNTILKNAKKEPEELERILAWYGEQRFIVPIVKATIAELQDGTMKTSEKQEARKKPKADKNIEGEPVQEPDTTEKAQQQPEAKEYDEQEGPIKRVGEILHARLHNAVMYAADDWLSSGKISRDEWAEINTMIADALSGIDGLSDELQQREVSYHYSDYYYYSLDHLIEKGLVPTGVGAELVVEEESESNEAVDDEQDEEIDTNDEELKQLLLDSDFSEEEVEAILDDDQALKELDELL